MNVSPVIKNILSDVTGQRLLSATQIELQLLKSWFGNHADPLKRRSRAVKAVKKVGWTSRGIAAILWFTRQ